MKFSSKVILLLNGVSTGVLLPVLSMAILYKGFTLGELAIFMGIYSLSAFLVEVPSGILADIMGRKRVFILSCLLNIAASAGMIFLQGYWTVIALVLWGSGRAFQSGSLEALAIDSYIEEKGKERLADVTTALAVLETVSLAAGSVLGGFLPSAGQKILPWMGTYDLNLLAKCAVTGVVVLLACLLLREAPKTEDVSKLNMLTHMKKSVRFAGGNRKVLLIAAGVFCTGFLLSTVETYWQPAFNGLTGGNMLYLLGVVTCGCFAFASAGNIVMKAVLNAWKTRWEAGYSIARVSLAACMAVFALMSSVTGFLVCFLLLYFLLGAANVAESAILNREIPGEIRAGFLSFVSFVFQGGAMVAPVFSSLVVQRQGISWLWLYTGIFLFAVSAGIGILLRKPGAVGEVCNKATE
jgi:DHA1 family quinolone resistance protein-like MFS transporter